jgi:cell division septation protein DedD
VVAFAVTVLALCARPAQAQDNPALQEALRLAAEGRGDEARRIVGAALAGARPGDPAYVEALYWRARLTAMGDSAERDLRRIAIEYPTSRWADEALLQLAQLAMAAGNPASAFALAERLRSDYPESDLRMRAAFWAGRAAFDLGDPRAGCALLDTARTEAAADIEFANQVAFYRARCTAVAGAAPPAAQGGPPAAPAAQPPVPAPTGQAPASPSGQQPAAQRPAANPVAARRAGDYTVQVAAVRTDDEERRVLQLLRRAGYEGRVVAGSNGFRRVRVGFYATDGEAQAAIAALRRVVGGRPFVVRER